MLCNTNLSLALKNELGKYRIAEFTIFNINKLEDEFKNLSVNISSNNEISIRIFCPMCNQQHYYRYKISDFKRTKMFIGGCRNSGNIVFFIGDEKRIYKIVNRNNEFYKPGCAML